jgi:hypothetical protein
MNISFGMIKAKHNVNKQTLQDEKTKEEMERVAYFLNAEDKKKLYSGEGFVKVPEEERKRLRIDAYPYLM